jgi:hypothetical protein
VRSHRRRDVIAHLDADGDAAVPLAARDVEPDTVLRIE